MEWVAEVVLDLAAAAAAEEAILIGLGDIGLSDAPGLQPIAPSKPISLSVDFPSRRDRWQTEMVFGAESHVVSHAACSLAY